MSRTIDILWPRHPQTYIPGQSIYLCVPKVGDHDLHELCQLGGVLPPPVLPSHAVVKHLNIISQSHGRLSAKRALGKHIAKRARDIFYMFGYCQKKTIEITYFSSYDTKHVMFDSRSDIVSCHNQFLFKSYILKKYDARKSQQFLPIFPSYLLYESPWILI